MKLNEIIDLSRHPLGDEAYIRSCQQALDGDGVVKLDRFLTAPALIAIQQEAEAGQDKAYYCVQNHSVYLSYDNELPDNHPRNRDVVSSKGCICDDVIAPDSALRNLYNSSLFRRFVSEVTGQTDLHPYADPLSSINIHYAGRGQELGWHFDNSSFAITLLIQKPDVGSRFEYVRDFRDADAGEMNFDGVGQLLDGAYQPDVLNMEPGALVLFRGRNSIHRVSPNESDKLRMLAVLAYNSEPGVSLSESARMTFYGRLK